MSWGTSYGTAWGGGGGTSSAAATPPVWTVGLPAPSAQVSADASGPRIALSTAGPLKVQVSEDSAGPRTVR